MDSILTRKGYLLNPFCTLYQDDTELSKLPELVEIDQYARDLEDDIEGDFDIDYIVSAYRHNEYSYVKNGLLLTKLKFLRLYRNYEDGTFATFCKNRLGKKRWQINDTITSARIFMVLLYAGFEILPKNISQAMVLSKLPEDELVHSWRSLVETIPEDELTAKNIKLFLFPPTEDDKAIAKIKVPANLHEEIYENSINFKLSIVDFIRKILDFFLDNADLKSGFSHPLNQDYDEDITPNKKPSPESDLENFGGVIPY